MDEEPCCNLSRDTIDEDSSSSAERPHKYDSEEAQLLSELIWRVPMEERRQRINRLKEQDAENCLISSGESNE